VTIAGRVRLFLFQRRMRPDPLQLLVHFGAHIAGLKQKPSGTTPSKEKR
jgi:hypothetical protein